MFVQYYGQSFEFTVLYCYTYCFSAEVYHIVVRTPVGIRIGDISFDFVDEEVEETSRLRTLSRIFTEISIRTIHCCCICRSLMKNSKRSTRRSGESVHMQYIYLCRRKLLPMKLTARRQELHKKG